MPRLYWKPERKEIDEWFEHQVQEFAIKENRSESLTTEEWKNVETLCFNFLNFTLNFREFQSFAGERDLAKSTNRESLLQLSDC